MNCFDLTSCRIVKCDIYWIYGVFSCYIQQYSPSTSAFFRPRPSASDEKMPRFRDYTVGYSPQTHRISITNIDTDTVTDSGRDGNVYQL